MPKVDVNGSRLFYKLSGAATGPVLLFSNSLGTTVEMWEPQLAAFESRYRILRYDMRGHGQSDLTPGPCSIAALGQDVVALLDELRIPKVHFCGLSVGGVIGQWLGVNAAQRLASLVLCNTAAKIGTPDGWNQRIADVTQDGMASITEAVLQRWFTLAFRDRSPEIIAAWRAMLLANDPRGYVLLCTAIRESWCGISGSPLASSRVTMILRRRWRTQSFSSPEFPEQPWFGYRPRISPMLRSRASSMRQ
jgi:3-oxoadipate enol-lactonase